MKMKTIVTAFCVFLGTVATNAFAENDFMALNTNAFRNPPAVVNPFTQLNSGVVVSVQIQNETTNALVTDPKQVARFVSLSGDLKVVSGWITLNGPGYFSLQHYRDKQTNVLLTAGINTTDGEVVVMTPTGIVGVAYESREYVRHVHAVQPFNEATGKIKRKKSAPNKTPEHISEGRERPPENAQR